MTKRLVVTDQAFGGTQVEEKLARSLGVEIATLQISSESDVIEATTGADVVMVNLAPITAAVLAGLAPGASVIRYGIGYDNVDIDAARRLQVAVANVPDYGSDTVADHAAACLLMLLRKIPFYDRRIRDEGWCEPRALGGLPAFQSTTVGLLGAGRIALGLARRLTVFGFRVLAHDPYADPDATREAGVELVDLPRLLAESDALSLHAPVTEDTRHMLNAALLGQLRPGSVLVNTSRGALVDEAALASALRDGPLAAAALDVFDPEPLARDSPLRGLGNVVFTPHTAFFSDDSLGALQQLATEEAGRALRGESLRCRVV